MVFSLAHNLRLFICVGMFVLQDMANRTIQQTNAWFHRKAWIWLLCDLTFFSAQIAREVIPLFQL
jgi:hypothetical protein